MFKKILSFLFGIFFSVLALTTYATVDESYTPVKVEADNSTKDFDFTFKVFSSSDISVYLIDITSGVETLQSLGSDYSVTLNTSTTGGTVTFATAPSSDYYVYIQRSITLTQPTDIPTRGLFREQQIENALDREMMVSQQIQEQVDRALKFARGGSSNLFFPEPVANKVIGWNSDGDELENVTITDYGSIAIPVPIADGGTNATTAAGARTSLGVAALGANSDITSLSGLTTPLSVAQGGTGSATQNFVDLSNSQTVAGVKTFSSSPIVPTPTTDYQASTKKYADDLINPTFTDISSTSTVIGWSSFTTKKIYQAKIGKLVIVFYEIEGTSNATTASFTVPNNNNSTQRAWHLITFVRDNGTTETSPGLAELTANGSTIDLYKTMAEGTWTNSGQKIVEGSLYYITD